MKKKVIVCLSVIVVLVLLGIVWYHTPIRLRTVDSESVGRIYIFDGRTGKSADITEREEIDRIVNELKAVTVKRAGVSVGYMGYALRITIYDNSGKKVHGWGEFVLNGAENIRKDPFFYNVVDGGIDFSYLESLLEAD